MATTQSSHPHHHNHHRPSDPAPTAQDIVASNEEIKTALAALRFACQMSTDISCKLNADFGAAPRSPAQLCAPAGATCYFVISTFASLRRIFPAERARCEENIAEKFESLTLFSYRWGIAGSLFLFFSLPYLATPETLRNIGLGVGWELEGILVGVESSLLTTPTEKMMSQLEKKMRADRHHYLKHSRLAPPPYAICFDFTRR